MDRDVPAVRVRKSSRHFVVFTSKRALVVVLLVVVLVAGMLAVGVPRVRAANYVASTNYPIVFVHGINGSNSINCSSSTMWGTMISYLGANHSFNGAMIHWTGAMQTIGFYNNDTNCSVHLTFSTYASHCTSYFIATITW